MEIHFQPEGVRVTPVTLKSSLLDLGSLTLCYAVSVSEPDEISESGGQFLNLQLR